MSLLACFGDSYAGLSLPHLESLGIDQGFNVDQDLVDPTLEPLGWLWENQSRIYNYVNTLPEDAVFYWSIGAIDALNGRPEWQIRQLLNQLIETMDSRPIYHFGYELWPPGFGVNTKMEAFYAAAKRLDEKHTNYHFVEMRGAIPYNEVHLQPDLLHLSYENYQRRVEYAWDTVLRYVL